MIPWSSCFGSRAYLQGTRTAQHDRYLSNPKPKHSLVREVFTHNSEYLSVALVRVIESGSVSEHHLSAVDSEDRRELYAIRARLQFIADP